MDNPAAEDVKLDSWQLTDARDHEMPDHRLLPLVPQHGLGNPYGLQSSPGQ
jgi:hypothetical protein